MGKSSAVEARLWHIFTYYALHGDPLNPNHLNSYQFLRFARECHLITKTLRLADVQVTFASEVTKRTNRIKRDNSAANSESRYTVAGTQARKSIGKNNNNSKRLLSYTGFLNALVELSKKAYPAIGNVQDSFQKLLHDKVLIYGSYRDPVDISRVLALPSVKSLFHYYEKPVFEIFQFYATIADGTHKDDVASIGDEASSYSRQYANSMKECVDYQDFLKFTQDFNFSNALLSTLEIADIYLSSIPKQHPNGALRKLTYELFWECLVRCALVAYDKVCDAPPDDKIKGMFLFMWRALQSKIPRALEVRRDVSVYSGDLLAGAMCFNNRFTAQWRQDDYRDYLSPPTVQHEEGKGLLRRLLRSSTANEKLESALNSGETANDMKGQVTKSAAGVRFESKEGKC